VGPRAGLDGRAKTRPYPDSIPGPYSLHPVATPTTLSRPISYPESLLKWLNNSVVCLTTGPEPLPKRGAIVCDLVNIQYPFLSLRSSSGCLRLPAVHTPVVIFEAGSCSEMRSINYFFN
jgi:hypothetical protein